MTLISMNPIGRCEARIDALRAELGGILADRILEAEAADFLWESRVREHYLGQHLDPVADGEMASEDVLRVAILSFFGGRWSAGICLLDGDGVVVGLLWKLTFAGREEAEAAFNDAR